ncbi:MAG: hypothetical protein ACK5KM_00525 [Hyphomicrobiaceae bacterium]
MLPGPRHGLIYLEEQQGAATLQICRLPETEMLRFSWSLLQCCFGKYLQYLSGAPEMMQYTFHGPDFTSPEKFVESFAADYRIWHDAIMAVYIPLWESHKGKLQRDLPEEVNAAFDQISDEATTAYRIFLTPYLAQGVKLQGVAYGSGGAFFDPERLTITGTSPIRDGFEVSFSVRDSNPDSSYLPNFVAELETGPQDTLKLRQVWLIDGNERVPCL